MKAILRKHLLLGWCLQLALFAALPAFAQDRLLAVTHLPEKPSPDAWYFDSLNKQVAIFHESQWIKVPYKRGEIYVIGNYLYMREQHTIWNRQGKLLRDDAFEVMGDDSIACFPNCSGIAHCINYRGDSIIRIMKTPYRYIPPTRMPSQLIGGRQLYCLPLISLSATAIEVWYQFDTWGMIDVEGQWRIPPMFDEPFRFQDGFAEVIYYGQKRKINEKGEFVE